jgi:GMP reductase
MNMLTCLHKHYTENEYVRLYDSLDNTSYWAYSMGISTSELEQLKSIQEKTQNKITTICIDVANGYTERFINFVSKVRNLYPDVIIIAGNVVTAEVTEQLILAGADIVKVGIGSGSACTTRIQAGVGYPQLSAVIECADAAHGLGGRIMSDGGCTCPGDVSKAFGGGADFVMLGGMLAGHNENLRFDDEGRALFYGMSSDTAMNKYHGGVNDYRSSEGRTIEIDRKGPLKDTLQSILGGIRSTCTYIGASELRELSKCTTFIRVRQQYNTVFESKTI